MLDIVLFQPEIPQNTGNIIRLCANTGYRLHLIQPLGFHWDDKKLKRAGLDYHEYTQIGFYQSLADFLGEVKPKRVFVCTTKGSTTHTEPDYLQGDVFLFGSETKGLPLEIIQAHPESQRIRIPMLAESRSLNLANSVSVILYESWRQLNFIGAKQP